MSYTQETAYIGAVNAALKYSGGRVGEVARYLGSAVVLPDGLSTGVFSIPIWTAMTAQTITDGTTQTNALNNSYVAFDVAEKAAPISFTPKQAGGNTFTGENRVKAALAQAESIRLAAWQAYLDALISGTPTTSTNITAGKANFVGATTTELALWLTTLNTVAANRGGETDQWRCIMHPTSYSNFAGAVAALWPNFGFVDAGGMYRVHGCPTIPVPHPTTSSWGQVSAPTAFFLHPEDAALAIGEAQLHGGGMIAGIDATYKWIVTGIYAFPTSDAMAQGTLTGELANQAS